MTNPSEQLKDITAMIAEARDAVFIGKSIDMTEIQGLVHEVCEAIQQNPPTDEGRMHDKIVSIVNDLNVLVEELKVQQKQVEDGAIRKSYKENQDEI
jgi:hypothetical protein